MKTAPIVPATLARDVDGVPRSPEHGDIYHPRAGALQQARHVFLAGNALPLRWRRRERFVILETGFGLGNNFLATWQAWRDDPQRAARLIFVSIEQRPLSLPDLIQVHRDSPLQELATALQRAWPPLTPNLHRLAFDAGQLELHLAFGDVHAWLPELVLAVDAFYLDGFAPALNPRMWDARVCKALGRLAAPGATLATWSAARALRDQLTSAGFEVSLAPGSGGKRDITLGRFAPRFAPRRAAARTPSREPVEPRALIVGAGLAGCAAAAALAEAGWHCTLFERRATIASEASGNLAGLFHGIVHADDGVYARAHRAAALAAHHAVRDALDRHGVEGSCAGLLRLEGTLELAAMQALLQRLGLPADYVQALGADAASARAGIELAQPAWFYPGGGWVQPAGLARAFLERAGPHAELHSGVEVQALQRHGALWRLIGRDDEVLAEAATVVLANAADAARLAPRAAWPIEKIRGQISVASAHAFELPRLPVAGAGYLLPAVDGLAVFGATAQVGDDDPSVRPSDHQANLMQLERLLGRRVGLDPAALQGRTAWRAGCADRLPLIGAVPEVGASASSRLDQPRFVPRQSGLFVFAALGSRGIPWSALGAPVLAALISGAPVPLEADLLDALDPARFISRRARRNPDRSRSA